MTWVVSCVVIGGAIRVERVFAGDRRHAVARAKAAVEAKYGETVMSVYRARRA